MAAGKYNFTIEQGATTVLQIVLKDGTETPVDLTGYAARMHIRETIPSTVIICSLSSSILPDNTGLHLQGINDDLPLNSGTIGMYISAATSSAFNFNAARYDIELVQGDYVNRILQGVIRLDKEVTR